MPLWYEVPLVRGFEPIELNSYTRSTGKVSVSDKPHLLVDVTSSDTDDFYNKDKEHKDGPEASGFWSADSRVT
jgi:hypothetical protein